MLSPLPCLGVAGLAQGSDALDLGLDCICLVALTPGWLVQLLLSWAAQHSSGNCSTKALTWPFTAKGLEHGINSGSP